MDVVIILIGLLVEYATGTVPLPVNLNAFPTRQLSTLSYLTPLLCSFLLKFRCVLVRQAELKVFV